LGLVILSAATACFTRRQKSSQLFYAPSFPSKMFSSISFHILATVSIKLCIILLLPAFIILVHTQFCKMDLQKCGFFWQRTSVRFIKRRWLKQFLSEVSENQTLNGFVPSLTAALLLIPMILDSYPVFRVDKISDCCFICYSISATVA